MSATSIEWTDFSTNPLRARLAGRVGHYCEKVSAGCKNCYSSRTQCRFGMPTFSESRALAKAVEHFLDPSKLEEVLRRKKPTKWFWCDMTDMFGDWVPFEWIAACFGVMAATPWHTHQVLTKRPERALAFFRWCEKRGEDGLSLFPDDPLDWRIRQLLNVSARRAGADMNRDSRQNHGGAWPLPNVWLGTSVENQRTADERIPTLLRCPVAVRFVSAEPLLGPVSIMRWVERLDHCDSCGEESQPQTNDVCPQCGSERGLISTWGESQANDYREGRRYETSELRDGPELHWVIVGGESGPGARTFDIQWARDIVGQCRNSGVAVFVKQLGARPVAPVTEAEATNYGERLPLRLIDRKGGDMSEWWESLRVREFPELRP
ncbi:MAG TPA: DUF5131 family protein [Lacunisphaera sp.]|nr:DUF5131 family protein [Lacunisphaera sp.]